MCIYNYNNYIYNQHQPTKTLCIAQDDQIFVRKTARWGPFSVMFVALFILIYTQVALLRCSLTY